MPSIPPDLDEARFTEIGAARASAPWSATRPMCCRTGSSLSESEVALALQRIIEEARGRVAVTTFGSHVGRTVSAGPRRPGMSAARWWSPAGPCAP